MATEPVKITGSLKLGPDCELDLRAYELRRSGRPIKLERIPMELLILLVEHRGELVVRQQILARIWGENVCLDADNSINAAIRKLRQALRDDPAKPRFIQTVTGKGYRFIASVSESGTQATLVPEAQPPAISATASGPPHGIQEPLAPAPSMSTTLAQNPSKPTPGNILRTVFAVAITLIVALGLWTWSAWQRSAPHPQRRTMLAVLPFQNLTNDPNQEYFTDGLTEEMISRLGDLDPKSFGVIAPSSVMLYKEAASPLNEIARKLQVQYIVQGSVRRDDAQTRISVSLVSGADQAQLWSKSYALRAGDLLIIQADIASSVAGAVRTREGKSEPENRPATAAQLTPDQIASHDLYLKGLYFWNKRTVPGFKQAIDYYQQSVDKDPKNARALAGIADCYALISGYEGLTPAGEVIPKAREAARRARELDSSLPEVHTALALIAQNYDWDWETAEIEYRRAIELNDSYATAHQWYGELLGLEGRFDEAIRETDRALELDPLSLIIATDRGVILYYSRQYDRALAQFQSVRDRDRDFPRVHMIILPYLEKGLYKEAIADLERWEKTSGQNVWLLATAALIYGRAGDREHASAAVRRLAEVNRRKPIDPAVLFSAYLGQGDTKMALQWLEKAYAAHSPGITNIRVNPGCDPLRQEPRFHAVLRGMNLE